jgi:hypothetical protein
MDTIKVDLREMNERKGYEAVYVIQLAQGRDQWWALVNMVTNLWVP